MSTSRGFFLLLFIGVSVLMWQIVSPYILTLITAAVAAVVVAPVEDWLQRHTRHHKLSSFITTVGVFFVIFIPLLIASIVMINQVIDLVRASLVDGVWPSGAELASQPIIAALPEVLRAKLLALDLVSVLQNITVWLAQNVGGLVGGALSFTAKFFINTVLFFLALYYFLVDRQKIGQELVILSPLKDKDDRALMKRVIETVRAVVFGSLVVAVVQGAMAAVGMAIFGIPGFLIWGALTIVASQVPILGVGMVMIPAIAYLAVAGTPFQAIGMLIWATVMVGLVDNLLGPYLIEGKTNMHALLILISILGALQLFGPIGLVIGPTVLAAFLVVIEMYKAGVLEKR